MKALMTGVLVALVVVAAGTTGAAEISTGTQPEVASVIVPFVPGPPLWQPAEWRPKALVKNGDLVHWASLLSDGGGDVLSAASASTMQTLHQSMDTVPGVGYGYGIFDLDLSFHTSDGEPEQVRWMRMRPVVGSPQIVPRHGRRLLEAFGE